MSERSPHSQEMVYQLKITLDHSKPPIWRRVLVPGAYTLGDLHRIIQIVMDWLGYHLHEFTIAGVRYGDPDDAEWEEVESEYDYRLDEVITAPKMRFRYLYDFGDSWDHRILVERIVPPEPGVEYPVCTKGALAAPPDDVGGIWGYYALLEALEDPEAHPDLGDRREWLGEFDPEAFDLEAINRRLRAMGAAIAREAGGG
jgi:hypothetical protein